MSRKITVVLEIEDRESAKEFWDAHIARRTIHGCQVIALAEGDLILHLEQIGDMYPEEDF